ncbi:MAG TPA: glycosyltransferase [Planctomycetes bacterium]|nr:glycosyltransferase [Planctomycetota bacterium]HIJ70027.1 glycosyltransferase [Planctomycetota bacterium]
MAKTSARKVAFISSFPPRRCGIATFTSDLVKSVSTVAGKDFEPLVVAMQAGSPCQYANPVKFEIRQNVKNDYVSAADYINFSHVDFISVQHEFGIFGGDAGSHLNLLLRRVNAPVITTLHTVLDEPQTPYYRAMVAVCEASSKIIVMNKRAVKMLRDIYSVTSKKVDLIPHGMPDLPFVDSSYYKHKFGIDGRRTILTFGLLSRSKGIEMMLKAMPEIVKADPTVLYIILGTTHPEVARHEGEAYRLSLNRMVKDLGLTEHVIFHNRFVSNEELQNFLCAADIYVTPYLNREQMTSGTLAYAVGTGKAVVSTPYWAAQDLLARGRGRLVRFNDPAHLAESIIEVAANESLFYSLRRKAYEHGRKMTWPQIGKTYWQTFSAKRPPAGAPAKAIASVDEAVSILEVPEPPLDHLQRLTDDTGLWQHAKFTIPDRQHGYCTDDNSRAVVAMTKYCAQYAETAALRLFETYLSFVCHAQQADGTVRNFMGFDRRWMPNEPVHDALGRTLWAFGAVMASPPLPRYLPVIKDCFDKSVKHVPSLSLRGKAYSIFGMAQYLRQFPGASDIKRYLAQAADDIIARYKECSAPNWQWFANELTYDNAALPDALYKAALTVGEEKYLQIANKTSEFLLENTFDGQSFSFVGCKGWYKRRGERAVFDQQPIEAASTVMMLRAAFDATGRREYLKIQKKAFDWFLGENDLHVPVYDFRTKGCSDGLTPSGVNVNQGAESMLSFLLSLLCVVEGYTATGKSADENFFLTPEAEPPDEKKRQAIKEIHPKATTKQTTAEKPA